MVLRSFLIDLIPERSVKMSAWQIILWINSRGKSRCVNLSLKPQEGIVSSCLRARGSQDFAALFFGDRIKRPFCIMPVCYHPPLFHEQSGRENPYRRLDYGELPLGIRILSLLQKFSKLNKTINNSSTHLHNSKKMDGYHESNHYYY